MAVDGSAAAEAGGAGDPDLSETVAPTAATAPERGAEGAAPSEGVDGGEGPNWPDASAEAAFLAEAKDRGETVAPAKAKAEIADETDAKALPALDALVQRIPAEVRDTLEDLFRAKFVRVQRVPKKALKA
jgi:hypothetical protein